MRNIIFAMEVTVLITYSFLLRNIINAATDVSIEVLLSLYHQVMVLKPWISSPSTCYFNADMILLLSEASKTP